MPAVRQFVLGALVLGGVSAGCVSGTPGGGGGGDDDDAIVAEGGRVAVPGCDVELITVAGAEAPQPAGTTLGADPAPTQLRLGFLGDPRTSMGILWRTDLETTVTRARYGTGGALDQTADGFTYQYIAGVGGIGDLIRVHEVHLCGLEPDTEYSYQVGGVAADGAERWSEPATFRTAPDISADPTAEVRVAFVGDSRGGYDVWAQLADEILARGVDLIMFSGDAVTVGQVQDEWNQFLDNAPALLGAVPIISAHGNHDLNSVNYYSTFAQPGDEASFAFDYGHAHMTVLNDSPPQSGDIAGSIRSFLQQDLAAHADATWKIVNHHRPVWSSGTRHGSDSLLQEQWGVLYDDHDVDLVVAGHDHIYERTKPMRGDEVQASAADGTIYLVSGGAGASLYGTEPDFFTEVSDSRHGAVVMSIRADQLSAEAFGPDGVVFDSFSITR